MGIVRKGEEWAREGKTQPTLKGSTGQKEQAPKGDKGRSKRGEWQQHKAPIEDERQRTGRQQGTAHQRETKGSNNRHQQETKGRKNRQTGRQQGAAHLQKNRAEATGTNKKPRAERADRQAARCNAMQCNRQAARCNAMQCGSPVASWIFAKASPKCWTRSILAALALSLCFRLHSSCTSTPAPPRWFGHNQAAAAAAAAAGAGEE